MIDLLHQKPLLGRQINWAHPLAKGFEFGWLLNEGSGDQIYDVITRLIADKNGTWSQWVPGGLDFPGGADRFFDLGTDPRLDIFGPNQDFSIVFKVRPASQGSTDGLFASGSSSANGIAIVRVLDSWDHFRFFSRGNTETINSSDDSLVGPLDLSLVLSCHRTSQGIWYKNGVQSGTPTTISDTASGNWNRGNDTYKIGTDRSEVNTWDGILYYLYIYSRALTALDSLMIHRNPNAMFQQNRARMFSIPAAGAAITVQATAYVQSRMRLKDDWILFMKKIKAWFREKLWRYQCALIHRET